jgi:hypothetical protein
MLLIGRALAGTAALWPAVEQGFVFVHAAARLLANPAGERGSKVRRRFDGLLAAMQRHRHRIGEPGAPLDHLARLIRHTGVTCVDLLSAGGRRAPPAPASAEIPTPISPPSNDRPNSQLCCRSFFRRQRNRPGCHPFIDHKGLLSPQWPFPFQARSNPSLFS